MPSLAHQRGRKVDIERRQGGQRIGRHGVTHRIGLLVPVARGQKVSVRVQAQLIELAHGDEGVGVSKVCGKDQQPVAVGETGGDALAIEGHLRGCIGTEVFACASGHHEGFEGLLLVRRMAGIAAAVEPGEVHQRRGEVLFCSHLPERHCLLIIGGTGLAFAVVDTEIVVRL